VLPEAVLTALERPLKKCDGRNHADLRLVRAVGLAGRHSIASFPNAARSSLAFFVPFPAGNLPGRRFVRRRDFITCMSRVGSRAVTTPHEKCDCTKNHPVPLN